MDIYPAEKYNEGREKKKKESQARPQAKRMHSKRKNHTPEGPREGTETLNFGRM